jgi:hypothetical protein
MESQGIPNHQNYVRKEKNKDGVLTLSNFKATILQCGTGKYSQKELTRRSRNKFLHLLLNEFWVRMPTVLNSGKTLFSTNAARKKIDIHKQKNKVGPSPNTVYKN